eukprot:365003-Chlamydomonas_euryale.AAC.2
MPDAPPLPPHLPAPPTGGTIPPPAPATEAPTPGVRLPCAAAWVARLEAGPSPAATWDCRHPPQGASIAAAERLSRAQSSDSHDAPGDRPLASRRRASCRSRASHSSTPLTRRVTTALEAAASGGGLFGRPGAGCPIGRPRCAFGDACSDAGPASGAAAAAAAAAGEDVPLPLPPLPPPRRPGTAACACWCACCGSGCLLSACVVGMCGCACTTLGSAAQAGSLCAETPPEASQASPPDGPRRAAPPAPAPPMAANVAAARRRGASPGAMAAVSRAGARSGAEGIRRRAGRAREGDLGTWDGRGRSRAAHSQSASQASASLGGGSAAYLRSGRASQPRVPAARNSRARGRGSAMRCAARGAAGVRALAGVRRRQRWW